MWQAFCAHPPRTRRRYIGRKVHGRGDQGRKSPLSQSASGASKDYEPRLKLLLEFMVFAGLVARDGTQIKPVGSKPAEKMPVAAPTPTAAPEGRRPAAPDENHAEFVFVLDAKRRRNVVVHAPHDMTQKEFDRVRKWMEIQLVAEDTDEQK